MIREFFKNNMFKENTGVSPVIGIILVVAVTVALVALSATLVFDLGGDDISETTDATINTTVDNEKLSIDVLRNENVEEVQVEKPDGATETFDFEDSDVGSDNFELTQDGEYQVFAVNTDGSTELIETVEVTVSETSEDEPFTITVDTENDGETGDDKFKVETGEDETLSQAFSYNYTVESPDGVIENEEDATEADSDVVLEFEEPGVYTLEISGQIPHLNYNGLNSSNDVNKIETINQWGDIEWKSFESAFAGADNLTLEADDNPDLSNVENMSEMFWGYGGEDTFNGNLSGWDTSNVKDMSLMFSGATSFNGDISDWDVSNVEDMTSMFEFTDFNQDISDWETNNVTTMWSMFNGADSFNQDISDWETNNVTTMLTMFNDADSFNQDISSWCVESISDKPDDFDSGANEDFENEPDLQPNWGEEC